MDGTRMSEEGQYNERITEIEHGTFTPLSMSANGDSGKKCLRFYIRLAELISVKKKKNYSTVLSWVKRKVTFSLINSISLCLWGSRLVFNNVLIEKSVSSDAKTSEELSKINT